MTHQIDGHTFAGSAELYTACYSTDRLVQVEAYETLWRYLYRVALHMLHDQPDAEHLAQDCAQVALVRVHEHLTECRAPGAFRAWARRIVTNVVIDELRRRRRLVPLPEDEANEAPVQPLAAHQPSPEVTALKEVGWAELLALIGRAPISERSRRVVLGRYKDDLPDEILAQEESQRAGRQVRPSHVQVTRAKDIAKLRSWEPLRPFFQTME